MWFPHCGQNPVDLPVVFHAAYYLQNIHAYLEHSSLTQISDIDTYAQKIVQFQNTLLCTLAPSRTFLSLRATPWNLK